MSVSLTDIDEFIAVNREPIAISFNKLCIYILDSVRPPLLKGVYKLIYR